MPYCGKCGNQLASNANFCGRCGAPVRQSSTEAPVKKAPQPTYSQSPPVYTTPAPSLSSVPPPPPPPPSPAQIAAPTPPPAITAPAPPTPMPTQTAAPRPISGSGEETVGVIVFRKPKSMGRYDSYAGVVTSQRLIFAQLTSEMITAAAQQARDQAKAEGKGFFGQWANQLKNTFGFTNRYLTMAPDTILAETAGNFALDNNTINEIKIHQKGQHDDNYNNREFEAEIKTSQGTFRYRMDENTEFTDLLKRAYGERVRMPFGYFGKSVNIRF